VTTDRSLKTRTFDRANTMFVCASAFELLKKLTDD
jgi:hypothetical protein